MIFRSSQVAMLLGIITLLVTESVGSFNMNVNHNDLVSLFERPYENIKVSRPYEHTKYSTAGIEKEVPKVSFYQILPDIPKGVPFSPINHLHAAAANKLIEQFMKSKNITKLKEVAATIRDDVNESLFHHALAFTIIRNPDIDCRIIPPIYEVFPNKFIPQTILNQAMIKAKQLRDLQLRIDREIDQGNSENVTNLTNEMQKQIDTALEYNKDFSGTNLNPEHRVAYWREDYGINSHHWNWHMLFPSYVSDYKPDRKGDIFFYMHNQMTARYDWERLSNGLNRVVKLNNYREPIPEGYFSKLTVDDKFTNYGGRSDNTMPQDYTREPQDHDISDLERWRERLFSSIHNGRMINKEAKWVELSDNLNDLEHGQKRGIDILGDAVEADKELSVNPSFYGSIHNNGHDMVSCMHDPHGYHEENIGPMGDTATAVRDPVFFRHHKFIDDIFQEHKKMQVPYDMDEELIFEPVSVENLTVNADNALKTGWDYMKINVSKGLSFDLNDCENCSIWFNLQHLAHKPFTYNIKVTNSKTEAVEVTVRLYMAPKFNEAGQTMKFKEQRLPWGEMDRYYAKLEPGENLLERESNKSSVTIPDRTFKEDPSFTKESYINNTDYYCGCGWPQHHLLPKGKPEGMDFQIFVLISDWELDKVDDSDGENTSSKISPSFCGILNKKYPDARPMGYPFDRIPNDENDFDVNKFTKALPNAYLSDIKIYFHDKNIADV